MFEDSLIESGNKLKTKRGATTVLSFAIQVFLLGILILIPLIYTDALPKQQLMTFLVAPPPPPPPPPPPAAAVVKVVRQIQSELINGQLRTPTKIPEKIQMIKEEDAPPPMMGSGVVGGVPGGVPGGSMGGVIGGIIGSTAAVPKIATPNPCPRVSGRVDRIADQEGYAQLSAPGASSAHSGPGRAAGGDQQRRHDSESAVD